MRKTYTALAFVLMLGGCGGGSDGSSPTTVPSATSVSGTVSKGLVKNATVLVCRIVNGAPEADANCASGTTGTDGTYSVTLRDGFTGPAVVKVMAATGSTMTDDTTGGDVPYGMTMRAVVAAVSGTTTVHVTPFSEMAANAASLSMPMDASKITQSIGAVQTLMAGLGIDLSVMPMVDLRADGSDSTRLAMEANMVKQLARVAMAAKSSNLLTDAGGVPCNAAATTASQQFGCAVAAVAGVMTGFATSDPTKVANMLAALSGQSPTMVAMPVRMANGTMSVAMTDMTSSASVQSALQQAGMAPAMAGATATAMMGRMM